MKIGTCNSLIYTIEWIIQIPKSSVSNWNESISTKRVTKNKTISSQSPVHIFNMTQLHVLINAFKSVIDSAIGSDMQTF